MIQTSPNLPGRVQNNAKQASASSQLRLVLNALRMHGIWVFLVAALATAGGVFSVMKFWKPIYEAKAYVRVIQNPEYFQVIPEKFQTKTDARDELAPIKSDLVIQRLLQDEEVRKQPSLVGQASKVQTLSKMINYRSAGGQELFEIVCKSTSPREAAVVASRITTVYLDFFREYRDTRLRELSQDLSEETAAKAQQIERINQDLSTLASQRQGTAVESIYDPDGEYLTELKKKLTELRVEEQSLAAEKRLIVESLKPQNETSEADAENQPAAQEPVDEAEIKNRIELSPEVLRLIAQRKQLEIDRVTELNNGLGESHRNIQSIDLAIRAADAELARIRQLLRKSYEQQSKTAGVVAVQAQVQKETSVEAAGRAAEVDRRLAALTEQIQIYTQEIARQNQQIKENNQLRWQFQSKQMELNRAVAEHDRLLDAESAIYFRKLSLPYQITREGAETVATPDTPIESFPFKLLAIVVALSVGMPAILAMLIEMRAQRISQCEQLASQQPLVVVGEIAALPMRRVGIGRNKPARIAREQLMYQESVDKISSLLSLTSACESQAIAITSAVSHEGKSTLSSQLAISLARTSQQKVLLIDADLRFPVQHRLFELENEEGLVDAIVDSDDWESMVLPTQIENLEILPAGKATHKPARYFNKSGWTELLERAKEKYSYVIVDTPPVLVASETVAICQACSRSLLCVLRDVSRVDALHRAQQRLAATQVNVMGCVFSGISSSEFIYRYGGNYDGVVNA